MDWLLFQAASLPKSFQRLSHLGPLDGCHLPTVWLLGGDESAHQHLQHILSQSFGIFLFRMRRIIKADEVAEVYETRCMRRLRGRCLLFFRTVHRHLMGHSRLSMLSLKLSGKFLHFGRKNLLQLRLMESFFAHRGGISRMARIDTQRGQDLGKVLLLRSTFGQTADSYFMTMKTNLKHLKQLEVGSHLHAWLYVVIINNLYSNLYMKSKYLPGITRDSGQSTVLLDLLQDLLSDFFRLRRLGPEVAELSLQPLSAPLLDV